MRQSHDIVIIGGGLAGLTAAAILARAGRSVLVLEKSTELGGRAITHIDHGFHFNLGAHAFYLGGPGELILRDLGIVLTGGKPPTTGFADARGKLHPLPSSPMTLLTTSLLNIPGRSELGRLLAALPGIDASELMDETVRKWVEKAVWQSESRMLLFALLRLATYANAPELVSAGVAITQLQRAMKTGVLYLDDGWGSLVESLRFTARLGGAKIELERNVARVAREGSGWVVDWGPETEIEARTVLLALPPQQAAALVADPDGKVLDSWSRQAPPVVVACLDLGLASLPNPKQTFVLGMEDPTYLSVHSHYASLAPAGMHLVHCLYYLHPTTIETGKGIEGKLELLLDRAQPGWRDFVEVRRYLPRMTVMHGLPLASKGGLHGRPGPKVSGTEGLYVAGDWVGPAGLLAEASIASAAKAAEMIIDAGR